MNNQLLNELRDDFDKGGVDALECNDVAYLFMCITDLKAAIARAKNLERESMTVGHGVSDYYVDAYALDQALEVHDELKQEIKHE